MRKINLKLRLLAVAAISGMAIAPAFATDDPVVRDAGTRLAAAPPAESNADINAENALHYVERLEANESVKALISSFALLRSANLIAETADLFADNATFDHDGGQWRGKTSIARLLNGRFNHPALAGTTGLRSDVLNERYVTQYVIDIAADNRSASARFREFAYVGQANVSQRYVASLYEAQFTNAGGIWRIASVNHCEAWATDYEADLAKQDLPVYPKPAPALYPAAPDSPDKRSTKACKPWPYAGITPAMHYPHPVTGEFINKP